LKIVFAFRIYRDIIDRLKSLNFDVVFYDGIKASKEWLCRELADAEILVANPITVVDKEVLDCAPKLKFIQVFGSGYENIDLEECRRRNICVANAPDFIAKAVAEHTLALTLAYLRNIVKGHEYIKSGKWTKGPVPREFLATSLDTKTVGIVGLGRVGTEVARIFRLLGAKVVYWSRRRKPEVEHALRIKYVPLEELLMQSDIVVLCLAYTKETHHFMDKDKLKLMKPHAILVNVSRGKVVDTNALVKALKNGQIKAALLDVFEEEPLPPNHPLLKLDNVIFTPHIAGYTKEAMRETAEYVYNAIVTFSKGLRVNNLIVECGMQ